MHTTILAQKNTREVKAIYNNGHNGDQIKAFCGDAAVELQDGEFEIKTLEGSQIAAVDNFIIQGANGEFYPSSSESFKKNYEMWGFDFGKPNPNAMTFQTVAKFVHTFQFKEDNFEDAIEFIADQGLDGVYLYRETPYGAYKIAAPNREHYVIEDGDIIVSDFRRCYPCKRDIFLKTYYVFGEEVTSTEAKYDSCRVFRCLENSHNSYMIESFNHEVFGICFQNGPRNEEGSEAGVSDLALLRIIRDRLEDFQNGPYHTLKTRYACSSIEEAISSLFLRQQERAERGVLGKNKP